MAFSTTFSTGCIFKVALNRFVVASTSMRTLNHSSVLSDTLYTGVLPDIPEIISLASLVADSTVMAISIVLSNVSTFQLVVSFEFTAH